MAAVRGTIDGVPSLRVSGRDRIEPIAGRRQYEAPRSTGRDLPDDRTRVSLVPDRATLGARPAGKDPS